ncbi:MAG: hypothetical protein H6R26_3571 [Proteobacteria bacterium]|nr:hypothetical protein [Pseudomonadota bacterium]
MSELGTLRLANVRKTYPVEGGIFTALENVDLHVSPGEFIAMGTSGLTENASPVRVSIVASSFRSTGCFPGSRSERTSDWDSKTAPFQSGRKST